MKVDLTLIKPGERLAVAVSGGADSMALLHFLLNNADFAEICAVNVEHGLRGEASVKDSLFVKDYCDRHGIKLFSFAGSSAEISAREKISSEQAARNLRYGFFDKLLASGACDRIATAHHAGDNAETVLLNLFRGSSLKGAAGIKSAVGKTVRPLLSASKTEILEYCKDNGVPFVTDETNFDTDLTRNFVRHEIMPMIKQIFPEAEKAINRFSSVATEEDAFLDGLSGKLLTFNGGTVKITLPADPVLIRRAAAIALKNFGNVKDYTAAHIEAAANLARLENGSRADFPHGVTAAKEYGAITFYKKQTVGFESVPFSCGEYSAPVGILTVEAVDFPEDLTSGFFADADKIPQGAVIRTRADGDRFTKFGGKTKKLKDFFIDEKVPLRLRDGIPLVAADGDVLFAGIAISDKIKVDKSTVDVIKLTYTKV